MLGVRSIDAVNRKVALGFADVPLQTCSGVIPVGAGAVKVSWRKADGTFFYRVAVPKGFDVTIDTARLPLKAVRE